MLETSPSEGHGHEGIAPRIGLLVIMVVIVIVMVMVEVVR